MDNKSPSHFSFVNMVKSQFLVEVIMDVYIMLFVIIP